MIRIQDLAAGEVESSNSLSGATQVQNDLATEISSERLGSIDANDGFLNAAISLERMLNIDVVNALNLAPLTILGLDWPSNLSTWVNDVSLCCPS